MRKREKAFAQKVPQLDDGVTTDQRYQNAMEWTRYMWQAGLHNNSWLGFKVKQLPTDLMIFQQLVWRQRPKVIVETGTYRGGSAIFFASLLYFLGGGRVISIDVKKDEEVEKAIQSHMLGAHVTLVHGDSAAPDTIATVRDLVDEEKNVMVFLDSHHGYEHVKAELSAYAEFVPLKGYLVVEDTICFELSKLPGFAVWRENNPLRAVDEFLETRSDFVRDERWEKFMISYCPRGFLRRQRA